MILVLNFTALQESFGQRTLRFSQRSQSLDAAHFVLSDLKKKNKATYFVTFLKPWSTLSEGLLQSG